MIDALNVNSGFKLLLPQVLSLLQHGCLQMSPYCSILYTVPPSPAKEKKTNPHKAPVKTADFNKLWEWWGGVALYTILQARVHFGTQPCFWTPIGPPVTGVSSRSFALHSSGPTVSAANPLPSSTFFSLLSNPFPGKKHTSQAGQFDFFLLVPWPCQHLSPHFLPLAFCQGIFPTLTPHKRNSDAKYEYNFILLHAQL